MLLNSINLQYSLNIKLKFEFYGSKIEPVLDRLPTATILEQDFDKYVIEAEVYGKGIVMWLFSQSSSIKVLSPPSLVEEMKDELRRLSNMYNLQGIMLFWVLYWRGNRYKINYG